MKDIIEKHLNNYPKMQMQDLVKLIYQSEFGCGHFVSDKVNSLKFVKEELEKTPACFETPLFENIGDRFERINFSAMKNSELTPEIVNSLFVMSANQKTGTPEGFLQKLDMIKTSFNLDTDFFEKLMKENNFSPISHSEEYRKLYNPAYRVIYSDYKLFIPILEKIESIISKKERICITIDGRCAAGKTTLTKLLSSIYDTNVIHMDDFFLPLELRSEERFKEPGGNIHYERFLNEVINNIKNNNDFEYNVFDCSKMSYVEKKEVKILPITIIEGSYSMRPEFREIYDLKIFVDVSKEEQKNRLLVRNRDMFQMFVDRFIPMEENYFNNLKIREQCDIVINL
ncbi:MAG: hypothetical protein FWD82_05815 [Defluviitaleaceae bacterium]|nr:hypothetical protein [Defluviitaleaceae bacterium]